MVSSKEPESDTLAFATVTSEEVEDGDANTEEEDTGNLGSFGVQEDDGNAGDFSQFAEAITEPEPAPAPVAVKTPPPVAPKKTSTLSQEEATAPPAKVDAFALLCQSLASPPPKVAPPVAAKAKAASPSDVKQKLTDRRANLGADSPAASPTLQRPASAVKNKLTTRRSMSPQLDQSIHGEAALVVDQSAVTAKASQVVEVIGAKTSVLEREEKELVAVVSPEKVDPEKRANVRNSFMSTFGLKENEDDSD